MNYLDRVIRRLVRSHPALSSLLVISILFWGFVDSNDAAPKKPPLIRNGFAHNDYEHTRPLFDALDLGFCAVEADIYLVNGQLLVGHDAADLTPDRTLAALYLDPIRERVRQNGGKVHLNGPEFLLLIDTKSEAEATYGALEILLKDYSGILTSFTSTEIHTNAVRIVLSGNRPIETVSRQATRLAAIDGRLPDLESNSPPALIPLVSDNWTKIFQWSGVGSMPEAEKGRLKDLLIRAHQQKRQLRLWAAPDTMESWKIQQELGIDLINTDKLAEFSSFSHDRAANSRR